MSMSINPHRSTTSTEHGGGSAAKPTSTVDREQVDLFSTQLQQANEHGKAHQHGVPSGKVPGGTSEHVSSEQYGGTTPSSDAEQVAANSKLLQEGLDRLAALGVSTAAESASTSVAGVSGSSPGEEVVELGLEPEPLPGSATTKGCAAEHSHGVPGGKVPAGWQHRPSTTPVAGGVSAVDGVSQLGQTASLAQTLASLLELLRQLADAVQALKAMAPMKTTSSPVSTSTSTSTSGATNIPATGSSSGS